MMTKEIPLTQGGMALVSDADYAEVIKHRWYEIKQPWSSYARRTTDKIAMHRFILDLDDAQYVDHINGNGLDNRRCNLRLCTVRQNNCNSMMRSDNSSGFKGVSWYKRTKRWRACVQTHGKHIHLGYFDSPVEAAKAYDKAARHYQGRFAKTNADLGLLP